MKDIECAILKPDVNVHSEISYLRAENEELKLSLSLLGGLSLMLFVAAGYFFLSQRQILIKHKHINHGTQKRNVHETGD